MAEDNNRDSSAPAVARKNYRGSISADDPRPRISVVRGFFTTREEALRDARAMGYRAHDFTSTPSPELPLHWHAASSVGYVLEGDGGYVLNEYGERIDLKVGDKLVIPAGAVHAEGEVLEGERVEWITCWDNDKWLISNVSDVLDPRHYPKRKAIKWVPPLSVVWKFAVQLVKSKLPTPLRSML